jgi:hypothetical protein
MNVTTFQERAFQLTRNKARENISSLVFFKVVTPRRTAPNTAGIAPWTPSSPQTSFRVLYTVPRPHLMQIGVPGLTRCHYIAILTNSVLCCKLGAIRRGQWMI